MEEGGSTTLDPGGKLDSGGGGGGIVVLIGKSITITGSINVNGGNSANGDYASGGAGAGGSILFKGQTLTLGSNLATALAGSVGSCTGSHGGAASVGRIHADYLTSIAGTTNPTIDSRQDTSLVPPSFGGAFLLNFL